MAPIVSRAKYKFHHPRLVDGGDSVRNGEEWFTQVTQSLRLRKFGSIMTSGTPRADIFADSNLCKETKGVNAEGHFGLSMPENGSVIEDEPNVNAVAKVYFCTSNGIADDGCRIGTGAVPTSGRRDQSWNGRGNNGNRD